MQSYTRKKRGFLGLPGELRNMIYEFYFRANLRCEIVAQSHTFEEPPRRIFKLSSNVLRSQMKVSINGEESSEPWTCVRLSRLLGQYNVVKGLQTSWPTSLVALHLVCRLLLNEVLIFMYRETQFCFNAPKRINNFLGVISTSNLQNITKLQLHYSTYGQPSAHCDKVWQQKNHKSWLVSFRSAAKNLVNLKELEIWVCVNDVAPKLSLREEWVQPLLQFRRLTRHKSLLAIERSSSSQKGLQLVKVHVRTHAVDLIERSDGQGGSLPRAGRELEAIFGQSIGLAILGTKEGEAMAAFNEAWEGRHRSWQHHLGFAGTGW
ncbi:hypothetical protein ACN47E_005019 [Coniothyrium glycines]